MQVIADAFWSVWRLLGCVQCLRKTPGMWNKASGQNPHQPPPILCCRQVPPRLEQCHGTATAQCAGSKRGAHQHSPQHNHHPVELACPDNPLYFDAGIIQLLGKEVHSLHGVFAGVGVDVFSPGWYFNCRKGKKGR